MMQERYNIRARKAIAPLKFKDFWRHDFNWTLDRSKADVYGPVECGLEIANILRVTLDLNEYQLSIVLTEKEG